MSVKALTLRCWLLMPLSFACSDSRTSLGPELDPETRVVELSEQERRTFCEWRASYYIEQYDLDSTPAVLCGGGDQGGSVGNIEVCTANYGVGLPPECSRTVGDETRCLLAEVDGECPARFPIHEGSPCRWPDDCGIPYPDD
jgi:hypothetical protein